MVGGHAQYRYLYTMMHMATSMVLHSVDRCTTRQDATNHSLVQVPTGSNMFPVTSFPGKVAYSVGGGGG